MAQILGIRGSSDIPANERPQTWRSRPIYDFPSGKAGLTTLMTRLEREKTTDPQFNYWTKGLHTQTVALNANAGAADIDLTVASTNNGAFNCHKDTVLVNLTTNEHVVVTQDPSAATTLRVKRGMGTTAPAAMTSGETLLLLGTAFEEGSRSPISIYDDLSEQYNYCQIFKESIQMTGTGMVTHTRPNPNDPMYEAVRQAYERMLIGIEKSYLMGERKSDTGPNGKPRRLTEGIIPFIRRWATDNSQTLEVDYTAGLSITQWNTTLENIFAYGSPEKLLLAGPTACTTLNMLAHQNSMYTIDGSQDVFGVSFTRFKSPHGTLYLYKHPLFSQLGTFFQRLGLVIDTRQIKERPLRDMRRVTGAEENDEDGIKDYLLYECGAEWGVGRTHYLVTGLNAVTN